MNTTCKHESLRIKEITSVADAMAGNYRYLCTQCGQEVVVPMFAAPGQDVSTDDFDNPPGVYPAIMEAQ